MHQASTVAAHTCSCLFTAFELRPLELTICNLPHLTSCLLNPFSDCHRHQSTTATAATSATTAGPPREPQTASGWSRTKHKCGPTPPCHEALPSPSISLN
ncbi:hypothetical protein BDA96_03G165600 [Sorghum bicolor]|uniref:Uncharacterized protein n=2 Tax=Sorghum bicolor TaxID=4558 RepID=A0A921RD70_SORBI|nr:hypothetical protein BDA96_03G165600 [Sorghum bicolor]OQU86819.1 hypothetical protein SORBI_3003G156733 [Sorghum bicolor]